PLDRIVKVDRLRERPRFALAGGFTAAPPVAAHRRIALGHPPLRVDRLPVHPRIRTSAGLLGGIHSLSFWAGLKLRMPANARHASAASQTVMRWASAGQ